VAAAAATADGEIARIRNIWRRRDLIYSLSGGVWTPFALKALDIYYPLPP